MAWGIFVSKDFENWFWISNFYLKFASESFSISKTPQSTPPNCYNYLRQGPFFVVRKAQGTTPAFHHYAPLEPGYAAIRGEGSSEGWKSMMQENQKWNCLMKARNFLKRIKQHFCNTSWLLVAESFSPEQRLFMRWCAQAPLSLSFVKLGNLTNLQVGLGHGRFFDEVKEPRNDTTNDCV